LQRGIYELQRRNRNLFAKREKRAREFYSFIIIRVFGFVEQFMKHVAKLRLIMPNSELFAVTISSSRRTKSCHTFTGDGRIRFRINNQKYHKSALHCERWNRI